MGIFHRKMTVLEQGQENHDDVKIFCAQQTGQLHNHKLAAMKRARKALLGCLAVGVIFAAGIYVLGYYLTGDFRERRAVLEPLRVSRARLSEVEAKTHVQFTVWRRSTPEWKQTLERYEIGSQWDRHIAAKMRAAAATGHTSTIDMQTWIFLDENDRLADFELGTQ